MFGGLRARLVAALLLTSAVTLGVAAFLLLSPLESRLRDDEIEALTEQLRADRPLLARVAEADVRVGSPALRRVAKELKLSTDAEIVILAENGVVLAATDRDPGDLFPEGRQALQRRHTVHSLRVSDSVSVAHVATPVVVRRARVAVVAVRRLDDASAAVAVVRHAFLGAAAISLFIALALGLLLANRLAQRLRALRDTALRVAELGPVVEMGADGTRDEVGDLTRALVTMQDRLRRQERARLAFVATASHELRTPLSSLRVMLDLLRDDLDGDVPDLDDARRQVARADTQAERLAGLAGDLLDLSRLDAGVPIREERVDLAELARAVAAEFDVRTRESGHELALEIPAAAWVVGDPGAIAQIVRILLDNAIRHGPPDGRIVLTVDRREDVGLDRRPRPGHTDRGRRAHADLRALRARLGHERSPWVRSRPRHRTGARGAHERPAGARGRGWHTFSAELVGRPGRADLTEIQHDARIRKSPCGDAADMVTSEFEAMLAHDEGHWWYRGRRQVLRSTLDRLPIPAEARLLDAGCGSGRTLDELARYGRVSGVDVNPDAVRCARGRGHADVRVGRIERLDFSDAAFDVVTCMDVIEHTGDDFGSLRELRRVTRPGGTIVLTVPAHPLLWSTHDEVNLHYRRYTRRALTRLAARTGMELLSDTYFNGLLLAPAAAVRWTQRVRRPGAQRSDLDRTPPALNRLLELPLAAEARLIARGRRIPAGLSLLCVLRRPVADAGERSGSAVRVRRLVAA